MKKKKKEKFESILVDSEMTQVPNPKHAVRRVVKKKKVVRGLKFFGRSAFPVGE